MTIRILSGAHMRCFVLAAMLSFTFVFGQSANAFEDIVEISPNTKDGKPITQYGSGFVAYWAPEEQLINALSAQGYEAFGATVNGQNLNFEALVGQGYFDIATQTFLSLPDGQPIRLGIIRGAAKQHPHLYAGKYVVTWDGDAEIQFDFHKPVALNTSSPNRLEGDFAIDQAGWTGLKITKIGSGGVRNIKAFRATEEDAFDAGAAFSTRWVDFVSKHKVLRMMDPNMTNASGIRRVDQIADETTIVWSGDTKKRYPAERKRGFPLRPQFQLAKDAGVSLWLNAPPMLGAPDIFDTKIYFEEIKVNNENRLRDRAANHIEELLASDEMTRYAEKLVTILDETQYPNDQVFYLELGNEIWNYGGPFAKATHYYWGVTRGLQQDGEMRFGYGYMSARLAHAFEQALEKADRRQSWKMVIGAHTAHLQRTAWSLDGVMHYLAENDLSNQTWMPKFGVATTSYYRGGFHFVDTNNPFNAKNSAEWRSKWLAALQANPDALADKIEDHIIHGPSKSNGTRAWVLEKHRQQSKLAAKYGADYIGDYEGGSHDTLDAALKKNPEAVTFYETFMKSDHAARIQRAVTDSLINEFPTAIISDFNRIGESNGAHAPWVEQMWGQSTPLTDVLDSYLRDPHSQATQ